MADADTPPPRARHAPKIFDPTPEPKAKGKAPAKPKAIPTSKDPDRPKRKYVRKNKPVVLDLPLPAEERPMGGPSNTWRVTPSGLMIPPIIEGTILEPGPSASFQWPIEQRIDPTILGQIAQEVIASQKQSQAIIKRDIKAEGPPTMQPPADNTAEDPEDISDDANTGYPWVPEIKNVVIDVLIEAKGLGLQNAAGFKGKAKIMVLKQTWKKVWKQLLRHFGHISGWGVNQDPNYGDIGIPIASEETMKAHYTAHSTCRKFRRQFPPYYKKLEQLLGDRMADGRFARGTTRVQNLLEGRQLPERAVIIAENLKSKRKKIEAVVGGEDSDEGSDKEPRPRKNRVVDIRAEALNNSVAKIERLTAVLSTRETRPPMAIVYNRIYDLFPRSVSNRRQLYSKLAKDKAACDYFLAIPITLKEDVAWFVNNTLGKPVLDRNAKRLVGLPESEDEWERGDGVSVEEHRKLTE
ncbi:hypothetical protein Vi05172_g22 [Venturia inaequalis]|nr:hypothetical protein Vi05172_g22 [Venturia inaequalis]